jgi:dynein light intermediate chain 2
VKHEVYSCITEGVMPNVGENDLWDIAIKQSSQADLIPEKHIQDVGGKQAAAESTIILMGSKSAGKTSMILRFLEKEEHPKPTTALEYTFGRKAKGHNMNKNVAHIWELGGGTFLSDLVEVAIKEDSLLYTSVVLVLDLSHPNELWATMEMLIETTLQRIKEVMAKLSEVCPKIHEEIKKKPSIQFGDDHPDLEMIDPFPLPLVIVGTKYDVFQDFDADKRKMIVKTLRFVAHNYGAALQFCSNKNEGLMNRIKAYIGHLVFGTPLSKNARLMNVDCSQPVTIPFGMDSLEQIGLPPMSESDVGHLDAGTPLDLWKRAFTSVFPQKVISPYLTGSH